MYSFSVQSKQYTMTDYRKCSLLNCTSRFKSEHSFLKIKNCSHFKSINFQLKFTKNPRICELHFEERFLILNSKRLKLRPAAYPTVFPDIRGPEPEPEKDHLYAKTTPCTLSSIKKAEVLKKKLATVRRQKRTLEQKVTSLSNELGQFDIISIQV